MPANDIEEKRVADNNHRDVHDDDHEGNSGRHNQRNDGKLVSLNC